jgi:peptide/nickel transport system substrate-binding protein
VQDDIATEGSPDEQTVFTRTRLLKAGAALLATPALLTPAGRALAGLAVSPRRGGTIRVAYGGEATDTVTVFKNYTALGFARARNIWEPLVDPDPNSKGIRMNLAQSIKPNADGSEWTIKLRDGIKWQDGTPFSADDVVYTIKTYLDPAVGSATSGLFSGADPAKVVKVDRLTVRVGLKEPVADFVETLGADGGAFIAKNNSRGTPQEAIGTGPFKITDFKPGQYSKLVRNTYYRKTRGGGPYADALEYLNVNSEDARINALRSRQVEYAGYLSPASAKKNAGSSKVVVHKSERGAPYVFNINMRVKPFDDPRVRLALKLACNRKQLVANTMLGYGTIGNDMYGIGTEEYPDNVPQRQYDPARARQLLQQAGVTNLELPIYVFNYGTENLGMSAVTLYAEQLKQIGIRASVEDLPYLEFRRNLSKYTPWIPMYSYLQSDIAPSALWFYIYTKASAFNYTGWFRAQWEARYNQAKKTLDPKKRNALYHQLQRDLWNDGGEIVWGFAQKLSGASPRLHGVVDYPDNYQGGALFTHAWLNKV